MGKITFLAGVGVGYVLGAAAGRQRYEQIKSAATRTWNNPTVQKGVDTASDQAAKGAKSATSSLKDAAAGTPASGLVDAAAATVEEKTGVGVDSKTSASPGAASSGSSGSPSGGSSGTSSRPSGTPTTGSRARGPVTARSENTDHEASGSGTASKDSGFDASDATPDVAPLPKTSGTSKP